MPLAWEFESNRDIDLICMGRVAVDLYSEDIGASLEATARFSKYLGGCAGNIAVGASRLGLKTSMFSCVGTDAMGQFLKQTLAQEKVNLQLLQESDHHLTGLVLLGIQPPDVFPLIFYRENCADMQLKSEHVSKDFFAQAKALLITGTGLSTPSMLETTQYAIQVAKTTKTRIIIDLDYRPVLWGLTTRGDGESRFKISQTVSGHYQTILPHCNLVVGTEEEIFIAGNAQTVNDAIHNIRQFTEAPIIVKRGAQGCEVHLPHQAPLQTTAYPVTILNVLGAGDAFISGLLRGLLRGESWATSTAYANACGAIVVTRHGCAPAMPYFNEMQLFIKEYQENSHVRISHS